MTRFRSEPLAQLIKRLQRINRHDEMTKEDADELLTGALALNHQFFKLSGNSRRDIKKALQLRIRQTMKMVDEL